VVLQEFAMSNLTYDVIDGYDLMIGRPDSHLMPSDCSHSCFPGKMDVYPQRIFALSKHGTHVRQPTQPHPTDTHPIAQIWGCFVRLGHFKNLRVKDEENPSPVQEGGSLRNVDINPVDTLLAPWLLSLRCNLALQLGNVPIASLLVGPPSISINMNEIFSVIIPRIWMYAALVVEQAYS
jgi:hypothetical protein